jgi:uncharacterized flavoprotein (TIGR03862 family)
MVPEKIDVLVVGGGPAGLRAAEVASAAGKRTLLADHKPSVGRKFLVAGRGGLNLTHSEPVENFPPRYGESSGQWGKLLADFSPVDLRAWTEALGIETFIGTSGRVFPTAKKAAPLLRRWIERLRKQGVSFKPRHELMNFQRVENGWDVEFATTQGPVIFFTSTLILALGGASWPQTGSDGGWIRLLEKTGIHLAPFAPANCGYEVAWHQAFLDDSEGLPLKNVVVRANKTSVAGELLITKYGLEGGALYQLGHSLRRMAQPKIEIDLKPAFTAEQLSAKIRHAKGLHLLDQATRAWRLSRAASALLQLQAPCASIEDLASLAKNYPLSLQGPRPIAEAISSAGGVIWDELDDHLMLKKLPGIFCAGEMIDWDAPTGGYLLQGCFSTATRAARGALKFLTAETSAFQSC